ncbi:tetratricopeptide repeat protein [Rhizomonospora bruguierae]|uniref:tetratricopeptide repeat protein n=1 Tax=Rhizomonospora bruguierae TaxID=1581705 RepID=UPI001BCAA32B|nr:tetratricopeptide repeat protein [Micromonospora sp. NBRC 107566]
MSRGIALTHQGRAGEAEASYLRALELTGRYGLRVREAVTLRALAALYRKQGALDAAQVRLRQALSILDDGEHASALAATLLTLGQVLADQSHPEARRTLESALVACRRLGVGFGQALALKALGDLCLRQGSPEQAVALCTEVLAIAEGLEGPPLRGRILRSLGDAHHAAGTRAAARDAWSRARAVHAGLGNRAEVEDLDRLLSMTGG